MQHSEAKQQLIECRAGGGGGRRGGSASLSQCRRQLLPLKLSTFHKMRIK